MRMGTTSHNGKSEYLNTHYKTITKSGAVMMKLFGKSKPKSVEEDIANTIMQQEDRLGTLFSIFGNLPDDLVEWFKGLLKT